MTVRPKVLLVDTLSATNDFGVELPLALAKFADLTVFTLKGSRLVSQPGLSVVTGFPEFGGHRSKLQKLGTQFVATFKLAKALWAHRRDVIHVQAFRSIVLELPLYTVLRPFLRKLVCTVHNVLPHERIWWQPIAYGHWYRMLHIAHVLSTHTGQALVERFGLRPERVLYAPHGNYETFLKGHPPIAASLARESLGLPQDHVLVFFFGLIRQYKGVDLLIAAAQQMRATQVTILIAGGCEDAMQSEINAALQGRTGGPRIDLRFGYVEQQSLSDCLAAADVVVFPYRHIYQSGALMLALTYGKAIVASDIAGFREYLQDGETAVLCDATDAQALAAALDGLVSDPQCRARLGENARRSAITTYAWARIARSIFERYAR